VVLIRARDRGSDGIGDPPIVGVVSTPRLEGLLERVGVPRLEAPPDEASFLLVELDGVLELRPPAEPTRPGIRAIFPPDRMAAAPGRSRLPLAKAFGPRVEQIHDGTAGLGGDAYRLAAAGYRVRAYERHPAVYALLASAWERARKEGRVPPGIAERLSFVWGEAAEMIDTIEELDQGVYLDPMYPAPRRSSALPRRALQVLRELIDEQQDPVPLVARARKVAARVVVKRPHHAPPAMTDVGFRVESKLVRFDVYLNPERMAPTR
jgi:16S rRNA (guanine1516-N2)-methyltransferase